ncbi:hypothetical protein B0H14DRAFT_2607948 [Mycena olivaceomarginata]|nr:hypothetical protein B0H14DRAFT_2607948 [Mycena olivaceomarginata]
MTRYSNSSAVNPLVRSQYLESQLFKYLKSSLGSPRVCEGSRAGGFKDDALEFRRQLRVNFGHGFEGVQGRPNQYAKATMGLMKETRSHPASAKKERGQRRAGLEKRVEVDGDEQEEHLLDLISSSRKKSLEAVSDHLD